ncbi:MAG: HNH endonuclease [Chitinophagales bacterium]
MTTNITLNLNEIQHGKALNFFSKYDMVSMLGDTESKFFLGNKNDRICRFCNRKEPDVTFKMDAHIIPELMGSHKLLSYFECDKCNQQFSKYEDSFANFIGVSRTVSQIKGKGNKVPKYKDPRTGLEIELSETGLKMIFQEGTDVFDFDKENKSFTLKTKRPGYIPLHVTKTLIKIGFSMLLDEELEDYEITRKFLLNTEKEKRFENFGVLRILGYFIPGPPKFNKPFVQLFKRKPELSNELIPYYQLIFYYSSYQFQIALPFGKPDEHLQGNKVDNPIAPLLIDNSHLEQFGQERFINLNLTSSEKVSGENHNISFSFESFVDKDQTKGEN